VEEHRPQSGKAALKLADHGVPPSDLLPRRTVVLEREDPGHLRAGLLERGLAVQLALDRAVGSLAQDDARRAAGAVGGEAQPHCAARFRLTWPEAEAGRLVEVEGPAGNDREPSLLRRHVQDSSVGWPASTGVSTIASEDAEGPAGSADGPLALDQRRAYETVTLIFMPSAWCGTQKKA
jgi:hypothetical protein